MNDAVDLVLLDGCEHRIEVADVGLHEGIIGPVLYVSEVGKVTSIGEFVDVDYPIVWILRDEESDHVATDKAGATRYHYIALKILHCSLDSECILEANRSNMVSSGRKSL